MNHVVDNLPTASIPLRNKNFGTNTPSPGPYTGGLVQGDGGARSVSAPAPNVGDATSRGTAPPNPARSINSMRKRPLAPSGKFHTAPAGHAESAFFRASILLPARSGSDCK